MHVRTTRMVSLTERHLAVMTFEVTLLDDAAPVAISSQILNRQDGEDEYHVPAKAMGEGVDPRKAERLQPPGARCRCCTTATRSAAGSSSATAAPTAA